MTRYMIAAGILAAAGTAHAAPMFVIEDDLGGIQISSRSGSINRNPIDGGEVLRNPGVYSASVSYDASELGPGVDEIFSTGTMTTVSSNTAFSISSTLQGALTLNSAFDPSNPADAASVTGQGVHNGAVTLTEDALVRIRVDGFQSAIDPQGFRVELDGPSLAPLSIGLDTLSNTGVPFDITVFLEAGQYEWAYNHDYGGSAGQGPYAWDSSLEFSMEIIPAPGATALFGLAGLTATRRRR